MKESLHFRPFNKLQIQLGYCQNSETIHLLNPAHRRRLNSTSSQEEEKHSTSYGLGLYIARPPRQGAGAATVMYRLLMMVAQGGGTN